MDSTSFWANIGNVPRRKIPVRTIFLITDIFVVIVLQILDVSLGKRFGRMLNNPATTLRR